MPESPFTQLQKLEIFARYKNKLSGLSGFYLLLLLIFSACNPTKYVPQDKFILQRNKMITSEKKKVEKKDLKANIKQKSNNRIVGIRFHLGLYNLSNIDKDKGIHPWLRKTGEPPVIFDISEHQKTIVQMKSFLNTKGYFDAIVEDSVIYSKQKAISEYSIDLQEPYKIGRINYIIDDPVLKPYILEDSSSTQLVSGETYQVKNIDNERERIEYLLKDKGFYRFRKDFIYFEADSTREQKTIDLTIHVRSKTLRLPNNEIEEVPFHRYKIGKIFIFLDYDPSEALKDPTNYYKGLDTISYKGFNFIQSNERSTLNYDIVLRLNYLYSDDLYNLTNVEQTRNHLSGLTMIRHVDLYFTEMGQQQVSDTSVFTLDCNLQIVPNKLQSYSIELEGTNSSGNFGASLSLLYQHRNLFKRAEVLNLKLNTSYEALPKETQGYGSMQEYGAEASILFPRLLLPFLEKENFVKKYNPKTNLLTAYNYQRRPEYERTMFVSRFGYNWQGNRYVSHIVTPIDLNVIKLPYIDSAFIDHIDTTSYLAYSYKNTFIAGLSYSFVYTNRKIRRNQDYYYFRFNFSTSGNMVSLLDNLFNDNASKTGNEVFGIEYSQYVKGDFNLMYNTVINDANSIVYRGFFGLGLPYGNSRALPFEKQYYTGGANDIRAWPVRSLGPGSHVPEGTTFYNQTADMKINFNIEYRFKIAWVLEGAFFVDAGNVWAVSKEDTRPGARFQFGTFLSDMAVGSGVGTRFDFSYFLFRLDFGFKMRDPQIQDGSKWVIGNPGYNLSQMTFHLAIGYPF